MSGTRIGGKQAAKTNKEKFGKDFYVEIGRKGGKARVPKGFALMDYNKVMAAGRKGGLTSKRIKKL